MFARMKCRSCAIWANQITLTSFLAITPNVFKNNVGQDCNLDLPATMPCLSRRGYHGAGRASLWCKKNEAKPMSEEKDYLKIEIPVEDETPFVPEQPGPTAVNAIKDQAANVAKQAWGSDLRKKATRGMKRGVTAVAAKSQKVVTERVVKTAEQQARQQTEALKTKLRETDWQHEAKQGTANGLRWLSSQLSKLAERFTPKEDIETGD
jgi:hypothetical protein